VAAAATALNLAFALGGASYLACFRLPFLGSLIALSLGALLAEGERAGEGGEALQRSLGRVVLLVGLPLFLATQPLWFLHKARTSVFFLGSVDLAFSLLSVGALMLLAGAERRGRTGWLVKAFSWRPLTAIGKISYGVYVGHRLLMAFWPETSARLGLPAAPWPNLLVLSALSIALAGISWVLIERPILGLKKRYPY
jgi:peptidoglycan/LPS O-acetylase OafA/YrhL